MLHEQLARYYGDDCRVVATRKATGPAASLFVVDTALRSRMLRMLGSSGRGNTFLEWSAMDLLHPERLVFAYERLMFLAFALVPEPASALLLGLGGGAMSRHLAAYLPACRATIVERDPTVIALARDHFHITCTIREADAEDVVADSSAQYDVILVDLYDAQGKVPVDPRFWRNCARALRSGGCIAINWAGFLTSTEIAGEIAALMPDLGRSLFLAERGKRPNMVQLAPSDPGFAPADLEPRLRRFAALHRLPREDRDVLQRADILTRYPPARQR